MTKKLAERIKESLDVSAAFDNCFFHAYALHLLVHQLPFPADLFTFTSIFANPQEHSKASALQQRFPNAESLSLFAEYFKASNPDNEPLSPNFIVEKTLILGFLLREWFASQMSANAHLRDELAGFAQQQFMRYRGFRWDEVSKEQLLMAPEGTLYAANQEFLEYFIHRPRQGELTPKEKEFEQFFQYQSEEEALEAYWVKQGYQNYCAQIANPHTRISPADLTPFLRFIEQPAVVYQANTEVLQHIEGKATTPIMELLLDVGSGHFHLLKVEGKTALLDEYERSYKRYQQEREETLRELGPENKLIAAANKSSLLLPALCPASHIDADPFALLIQKIDAMHEQTAAQKKEQAQAQTKEEEALKSIVVEFQAKPLPTAREEQIKGVAERIDRLLSELGKRVGVQYQHFDSKSCEAARTLLAGLQQARSDYLSALQNPLTSPHDAALAFKATCQQQINTAKSVLANDLDWNDYLRNLLKALCNAVIYGVSFGQVKSFFTPVVSHSLHTVNEVERQLNEESLDAEDNQDSLEEEQNLENGLII